MREGSRREQPKVPGMNRLTVSLCVFSLLTAGAACAKPQTIPLLVNKKAAKRTTARAPFKLGATKNKIGEWVINGRVTSVNIPAWTLTLTDGKTGYSVVVQRSTQFRTPRGVVPGMIALNAGDLVTIEGLGMDDGRVLAQSIDLRSDLPPSYSPVGEPAGATPGLFVSNLHHGMVVPPIFEVAGHAEPRAWVRVTVHSTHPLVPEVVNTEVQVFSVDGRADGLGRFKIPIRADDQPPGSRMLLEVLTGDTFGNRSGPVMVNVLRQ